MDTNTKTILIVDDDKTNLIAAKNALEEIYKIVPVPSGALALKYLETNVCDLILLDVEMPLMDGIKTLKEIRARDDCKNVPVIFLTANKYKETVIEGAKLGILDYITKPFNYQDLRERVAAAFKQLEDRAQKAQLREDLTDIIDDLKYGYTERAISKLEDILDTLKA